MQQMVIDLLRGSSPQLLRFPAIFPVPPFLPRQLRSVLWQENTVDIRVSPEKGDSGHLHLWSGIPLWPFHMITYHSWYDPVFWIPRKRWIAMQYMMITHDYWIRQFHILRQSPAAEHWTSAIQEVNHTRTGRFIRVLAWYGIHNKLMTAMLPGHAEESHGRKTITTIIIT